MSASFKDFRSSTTKDGRFILCASQSEDHFTSLTAVLRGVLVMHGLRYPADIISATSGDCFALQFNPNLFMSGLCGISEHFTTGLAELGIQATLYAQNTEEDIIRLATSIKASLFKQQIVLVFGGWPPLSLGERDNYWGILHSPGPERGKYLGNTMRDTLNISLASEDLVWPHYTNSPFAAFGIEKSPAPIRRESRKVRLVLQRGLELLRGLAPDDDLHQYDELFTWLMQEDITPSAGQYPAWPFPGRVAIRCQLETISRYLTYAISVVPARKRRLMKQVHEIASLMAQKLLQTEPLRTYPRKPSKPVKSVTSPWAQDAWTQVWQALQDVNGEARQKEITLMQELQKDHKKLIEILAELVTD